MRQRHREFSRENLGVGVHGWWRPTARCGYANCIYDCRSLNLVESCPLNDGLTSFGVITSKKYTVGNVLTWMQHVADALAYMHSEVVMHRDIKLANILLDRTMRKAKLADFNIAVRIDRSWLTVDVGTRGYIAPEVKHILEH